MPTIKETRDEVRQKPSAREHPLEAALALSWPPEAWQDVTVLLAVSGGADSVALLRAMRRLKCSGEGQLVAAHFNHGLRGDDADRDQAFVVKLCRKTGVHCETGAADVRQLAGVEGDGLEAAARAARYQFLEATAERLGARYVVTAHTIDDQAETILHRILRGCGLAGLAGIPRARSLGPAVTLIRPLLLFRRMEVIAYLEALDQTFREDDSNADTQFVRNRIRLELLPRLEADYNASVTDALVRLGRLAAEAKRIIDPLVSDWLDRSVSFNGPGSIEIDAHRLSSQPRYLVRELVIAAWRRQEWPRQGMGFDEWDLVAEMLSGDSPRRKTTLPGNVRVEMHDSRLVLTQLGP